MVRKGDLFFVVPMGAKVIRYLDFLEKIIPAKLSGNLDWVGIS